MDLDLTALLYDPLYASFGADAVIRCLYSDAFPIRAIDCTAGIEVTEGSGVDVKTIRPAAVIRMRELTDLGLGREDLENAAFELNDKLWRVKASMPKPGPAGEAQGELYLFLIEDEG
jgi:hypothetical protein